jgi:hypothetical protein
VPIGAGVPLAYNGNMTVYSQWISGRFWGWAINFRIIWHRFSAVNVTLSATVKKTLLFLSLW